MCKSYFWTTPKYLDSPGVNAKYVRSQISSLFNRVFARMPADERKVFADFFSLVQGIEKTDYPGNTVVDTGYLTQLADYADLFNTKKSSYLPTAGREEQRTEIVLDVDKQEDFIEGLSALGSEIKALDLKFNRIEKQVQPQPVVEKQKKAPDAEVKMPQKKVEPKVKANKLSEDDDDQVNLTENASRYDIPEREIYEYDEY